MVDEAVPLWEVEKKPRQVLSFINDSETRWFSTYAMLVHYYKLRASIQWYNEKAIQNKNLAEKVATWEIRTADYPKMKQVLVTLEKIKDIQMYLEASDQPNFMLIGHQIIQLLYTDETLNNATSRARIFASAFRNKLACCVDK